MNVAKQYINGRWVPGRGSVTDVLNPASLEVVAAIPPWSYPAELIGWKVGAGTPASCTQQAISRG